MAKKKKDLTPKLWLVAAPEQQKQPVFDKRAAQELKDLIRQLNRSALKDNPPEEPNLPPAA